MQLLVNFVHQKPGLCGAACAQMILNAHAKIGLGPADQDLIWAAIKQNTIRPKPNPSGTIFTGCAFTNQVCEKCSGESFCWCTFPAALAATISQYVPGTYSLAAAGTEAALTGRVVASLDAGVAPAVLVYGRRHWVVVYGYLPAPTGDPSYLYLHNPEWLAPKNATPIADWYATYLRTIDCGNYMNESVMVGSSGVKPVELEEPRLMEPVDLTIMSPVDVMNVAQQQAARLVGNTDWVGYWTAAFRAAVPRQILLVDRLGDRARSYYIVDFQDDGRSSGRMIFNALSGEPGDVSGVAVTGTALPTLLESGDIVRYAAWKKFTFSDGRTIEIDPARASVAANLVWKPCDQSRTRFLAFYRITQDADTVYVRTDGETFAELTENSAG